MIKYLGQFYDHSYQSWDQEYLTGFTSLRDAGDSLLRRLQMGRDDRPEYRENRHGLYVYWEENMYGFPAVSESASFELYGAIWLPATQTYQRTAEPLYRLTVGPRKGIVRERY